MTDYIAVLLVPAVTEAPISYQYGTKKMAMLKWPVPECPLAQVLGCETRKQYKKITITRKTESETLRAHITLLQGTSVLWDR